MGAITNSTLSRKTPLKRACFQRSKRPHDPYLWKKQKPKLERKAPMKPRSPKQAARLRAYYPVQEAFLARFDRRFCEICLCRSLDLHLDDVRLIMGMSEEQSERALRSMGALIRTSTEAHHFAGRCGKLLRYEPYLIASCYADRAWPHENGREARARGLLAEAAAWNVFPKTHLRKLRR